MTSSKKIAQYFPLLALIAAGSIWMRCEEATEPQPGKSRQESIPANAVKFDPSLDSFPPILRETDWQQPIPMPGPINTAGAEDSPFILPDGNTFFFFFTPDVSVPPNQQLFDGVTGIWWTKKSAGSWSEPQRIFLNNDVSLEGAEFVIADTMWFASIRAGNYGEIDVYTAFYQNGKWRGWENAGEQLNKEYDIGEFHIHGKMLYFHRGGQEGIGGLDLWQSAKTDSGWSLPVNLGAIINSAGDEGWPFITSDGDELWFCGTSRTGQTGPAVFRSSKQPDGSWGAPVEIVSRFAGEPTLDDQGNLYFVHHFFSPEGKMIEADIYVAYRK